MSETFTDLMAEIAKTQPRIPEVLDFSEERLKKVGIMVRPTLFNVLKFVRDNMDKIDVDVLDKLVKSYDSIYTTNNAYDLQTKLQLHVEGKSIDDNIIDEILQDEDEEEGFTPVEEGAAIDVEAEVIRVTAEGDSVTEPEEPAVEEPAVEEPAVEEDFVAEVVEVQGDNGQPAFADAGVVTTPVPTTPAAPAAPKATRKPREKSRVEELVSELMTKYTDMEKDHKRLSKANEQLTLDNTKLKEQLENLQSEGTMSSTLLDRLEKLVKGT